ncbi:hypothetical protein Caci_7306 [Catenulispora acidiphila DSM 44928]|uniref:Resolvase HTH domain-containing protein n=2 Tax=Catenulispora TaxID=414878 RepID=C7Q8E7_CATAD|nr:hypothetical protein Caci_7306 [Catenulispora acidiphila DSM 44928]
MAATWADSPEPAEPRARSQCRTLRQLANSDTDELVHAWEQGVGVAEIAARSGIHRSTVWRHLRNRGIDASDRSMGPNGLTRAIELYAEGRTLVQIAREFGVAKKTIRKRLVEGGVVIRRGGRASWESR